MKLTTKQLKRMIKEEISKLNESGWGHNYDDVDEVLKIIADVHHESDLMYHEADNIKKMIATLTAEIAVQQAEYNKLNKEYNDAQRTREGQMTHPSDWWDHYIFPIDMEIRKMKNAIETLNEAISGLVEMGFDPDALTDDEIDYQFDGVIEYLNNVAAGSESWEGETELRTTLLDQIEEYANSGHGWDPYPPKEKWQSIVHYVMDQYYKKG